jgi:proteasomal ATPase-associated factor 1
LLGNIAEGEVQKTLTGHLSDVTTVQFFPSNLVLLSGGADFQLKIWSAIDGSNPVTLKGHTSGTLNNKSNLCIFISYNTVAITSTAIIEKGRNVLCRLI